ncbi:MAG: TetR/AcrR family transcriptional regulator [Lachnospiraceae bacterium]|jgi:AcrR family transcriptional regulator
MRKKDDDKQQRIKVSVTELMLEEGWSGTSIAKIAHRAGVSPATVYTYFDNKEDMLQCIYREYADDIFRYMLSKVNASMQGPQIIDTLMRSFYQYLTDNEESFSFVMQFSNCKAMSQSCPLENSMKGVRQLLDEMKDRQMIRSYSDESLAAVIFTPVKALAYKENLSSDRKSQLLDEVIEMVQTALLR